MRSFEIFVEPEPRTQAAHDGTGKLLREPAPRSEARPRPSEVLDLFVHGANVTARVPERHASCVLRDLAWAMSDLVRVPRGKRIVRFYEDAWELCVERLGVHATLSVYRGGADPTVVVYDRLVDFGEMLDSTLEAIDARLARSEDGALALDLREARKALQGSRDGAPVFDVPLPEAQTVAVEIDRDAPIAFSTEFAMRPGPMRAAPDGEDDDLELSSSADANVERADLHALLVRGRMRAEIRGRSVDLGQAFPFLFAERMLELVRAAIDSWERAQPSFARRDAGGVMIGLRVQTSDAAPAALTIAAAESAGRERMVSTFPELPLFDVVEATLSFGRAFVRALVRRDRTQAGNLRLAAFRRDLRALGDAFREVRRRDARINHAPESYRAFAQQVRPKSEGEAGSLAGTRLRYQQRWRALVPGIDLRSTFLCGDRIVIGGATELFCLDRTTGELVWQKRTPRGASVVTPSGIARIAPDGSIALHDLATGDIGLRTWIAPRISGPCAGAVVNTAGLPRLLVLTEGERHIVAVDLTSGEARWRYAWGRGGALRLKRVGKLLYVSSGDSALSAVDVQTGAVVWRIRDRLRFRAAPTVDHDALFAVAGGVGSAAALHSVDPYSGQVSWSARIPASPCTVEGAPLVTATAIAVAVRDRRGLCLNAFDRQTGKLLFETEAPVAPVGTSWLAVDDLLIGNTPTGELVAIDAATGAVRYRHVLGSAAESDVPRRLEPVLRSGALFVPHVDVHVFRPRDGAHLATIGPCDAIPDLLRVDERCDVYVAEESGHMVAFGAGPRLSLVR